MRNMNKSLVFGVIILVVCLIVLDFIGAQPIIEPEVEEALQTQDSIRVIIEFNQSLAQTNIDSLKVGILSNLSEGEFILKHNLEDTNWFSGELTKEGLKKLKQNENILRIYPELKGSTTEIICGDGVCDLEENCENCISDCGCSETEECVGRECQLKKVNTEKNFMWLGITISLIIFLIIVIYFIKRKK